MIENGITAIEIPLKLARAVVSSQIAVKKALQEWS